MKKLKVRTSQEQIGDETVWFRTYTLDGVSFGKFILPKVNSMPIGDDEPTFPRRLGGGSLP